MYYQKAKPSWQIIDGKMIYVDSAMENRVIRQLISDGFSKKWRRTFSGIATGSSHYRPDIELCILHDSMNRRAVVELKSKSASEFKQDRRMAMLAASKYYGDAVCMLYVEQGRKWYFLELDGSLQPTGHPMPGGVEISKLRRPRVSVPVLLIHGQVYRSRLLAAIGILTAHGLEFGIKTFFGTPKKRRR
jgi:hypothetical protein